MLTYFSSKKAYVFGYVPIEYNSVEWWSPWWVKCLTADKDHPTAPWSFCKFHTNYPEYIKDKQNQNKYKSVPAYSFISYTNRVSACE